VLFSQIGQHGPQQHQTQNITISGDERLRHELAEKAYRDIPDGLRKRTSNNEFDRGAVGDSNL